MKRNESKHSISSEKHYIHIYKSNHIFEASGLPMLSVTVMMLRLMVESVILLKDDD